MKQLERIIYIIITLVMCAMMLLVTVKLYNRDERNNLNNALMQEAMAINNKCSLDTTAYNVLCIGNSITIHGPYNDINWYSNHGMAASAPQNDYCHILEQKLKTLNERSTVSAINISSWEINFQDLDLLLNEACSNKNLIIIRLGENVRDIDTFTTALSDLITYCKQYTSHVVITGMYWSNPYKEAAIVSNARKHNITYIPINWIYELHRKECSPCIGDTILDTYGNEYLIEGDFIITHPNDYGMMLIANTIYNAL